MRAALLVLACTLAALNGVRAQNATVTGQIVLRDDGQPLGYTTIAVLSRGTQQLAHANGSFTLTLPPGEVQLRFKRIGFLPKDTALVVAANDTARIRVEMTRLVIKLPAVVVSGACTDRTTPGDRSDILPELFEQVKLNAERMRLLAQERPFTMKVVHYGRRVDGNNRVTTPRTDTIDRPALLKPYKPGGVVFRITEGPYKGAIGIMLPELSDLADTAFTNNHCFWYAGQERLRTDSVIRVDFAPVPWLAEEELDLEGSIYLRVEGYQLVGLFTKLTGVAPPISRNLREYTSRAWFIELVSGVSVVDEIELMNIFRDNSPAFVQTAKVISIQWLETPPASVDQAGRPR